MGEHDDFGPTAAAAAGADDAPHLTDEFPFSTLREGGGAQFVCFLLLLRG